MKIRRLIRQLHRWLGLLIAAQLLLWVIGGLVMSVLRLEEVKGEDRIAQRPVEPLAAEGLLAPAQVVGAHGAPVGSLVLVMLDGRPVYRLKAGTESLLVDARSGAHLSPLPREFAERLARADYAGPAAVAGVDWVDAPGIEYRERALPLWRVRFADDRATAVYVSPATGEVVARRNDLWRLFDFVWMFHIMDYEGREDFNHPLLIATAASALLFLVTGLVMLVFSFRPTRP
jgi:uncharacterized iron-regulated membrane protein